MKFEYFNIEYEGPLAIIQYNKNCKNLVINLRNILEMGVRISTSFLDIVVLRRKDKIVDLNNQTAILSIYCASSSEAEILMGMLLAEHKGVTGCSCSSGIHDGITIGWGHLDEHGYWEHGCNLCARELERREPDMGEIWPFHKRS